MVARVDPHKLAVMRVSVDDACNFLKRVVTRAIRLACRSIGWRSNRVKSVQEEDGETGAGTLCRKS